MALGAHAVPAVALLKRNGCGHAQKGADIARAQPLQAPLQLGAAYVGLKPRMALDVLAVPPADHRRVEAAVVLGARMQEGRALGGAQPFVAVARVEVRAQRIQFQGDVARCVCTVDQGHNARVTCTPTQLGQREDQRRGGRDVTQKQHPCARRHTGPHPLHELGRAKRQGNGHLLVHGTRTLAHKAPGVVAGAVFVVGGQHLIACAQLQRARHHIHSATGIGHEGQVIRLCAQVLGQHAARVRQQLCRFAPQKQHRVALHAPLQVLLNLQDLLRARAKGAMVEKRHIGVQEKELAHG